VNLRPRSPVQQAIVTGRSGSPTASVIGALLGEIVFVGLLGRQWSCLQCATSRRVGGLFGGRA
jgi:hypothetical protein